MKKVMFVLSVALLLLTGYSVKAQSSSTVSPITFPVVAGDSLATADTVFKRITLSAPYSVLGIQIDIKKGTGTLDGKLYVLTSVNGLRYVLTDSAFLSAVPINALTTNAAYTHTAIITKPAPAGTKYIAYVTQAGSLTASPTFWTYTTVRQ